MCPTRLDPAKTQSRCEHCGRPVWPLVCCDARVRARAADDLAHGLTETIARAAIVLDALGATGEEPPSLPAVVRESEPIWWDEPGTPEAPRVTDRRGPLDLTRKADREAATDWLRDAIEGPLACGRGRSR